MDHLWTPVSQHNQRTSETQSESESEVAQSCPTLCDPMDCSLPGSSVHGMFQARLLEWVALSFSRRSPRPRDWTRVSHIVGRRFTVWATREDGDLWQMPHKRFSNDCVLNVLSSSEPSVSYNMASYRISHQIVNTPYPSGMIWQVKQKKQKHNKRQVCRIFKNNMMFSQLKRSLLTLAPGLWFFKEETHRHCPFAPHPAFVTFSLLFMACHNFNGKTTASWNREAPQKETTGFSPWQVCNPDEGPVSSAAAEPWKGFGFHSSFTTSQPHAFG